ncbi:MAG: PQQ-binding-like beta-propeller repeat protein [Planctomycetaceae bacterium]
MVLPARIGFTSVFIVPLILAGSLQADDWPQWRGPNRDGQWNETGILEAFPPGGLTVRWRAPVRVGVSTPIVVRGRVYITDTELVRPKAHERLHAFDEATGQSLWTYANDVDYPDWAYDEASPLGPRATPIYQDGKIFTMGPFGNVCCVDALKGETVWKKDLRAEYPGQNLECTASPLIDGDLLIVCVGAKPGACVIAFDKKTGNKVWSALDEQATFSSPIVIGAGGTRQLIVWTYQSVTALDPATGKTHWRQPTSSSEEFAVSTPVIKDNLLLVGGLMLKLDSDKPAATVLWPQSRAASKRNLSNTSTALFRGDFLYSAKSSGHLVCIEASTGKQVWETDKATELGSGASIHLTPNGQSFLLYNDRGELIRAQLTPAGYKETSRAPLLEPTYPFGGRKFAWSPPSYANRHIFVRNDKELICAALGTEP